MHVYNYRCIVPLSSIILHLYVKFIISSYEICIFSFWSDQYANCLFGAELFLHSNSSRTCLGLMVQSAQRHWPEMHWIIQQTFPSNLSGRNWKWQKKRAARYAESNFSLLHLNVLDDDIRSLHYNGGWALWESIDPWPCGCVQIYDSCSSINDPM